MDILTKCFTEFYPDDEVINNAQIPCEEIIVHKYIRRHSFGKVYKGMYNGQLVDVKTTTDVDTFMKEIKIIAHLSHRNIVQFIGVTWKSQENFCCIMEYMAGGDLRTLLDTYKREKRPIGFDWDKVLIALHVIQALAYLHSHEVPVIHCDLKSRNIFLNKELDAKVTDIGFFRDGVDRAMTDDALWVAPEVMSGNAYDEKADMFSFGVVLSELSMHVLPYSHAKCPGSNEPLPRRGILHRVAAGTLCVEFPETGPEAMVSLGLACVSVDPTKRPTAVEAMHKLDTVLIRGDLA